jgi:hypothetical protein
MRFFFLLPGLLFSFLSVAHPPAAEKVLQVKVDEYGLVTVGRDTVGSDQLARYIQERLFKSYLGTGQMHDRIVFETVDDLVPEAVATVIVNEIRAGQQKALQVICLQKFNRTYEMLDKKKQSRLQKIFPVLFQPDFNPKT